MIVSRGVAQRDQCKRNGLSLAASNDELEKRLSKQEPSNVSPSQTGDLRRPIGARVSLLIVSSVQRPACNG